MKRLETLGRLALIDGTTSLLPERRKDLALLVFLASHSGRAISRSRLAAMFWPTVDSARARQSLRRALVDLRGVAGDALRLEGDQVGLDIEAVHLDTLQFERDVAAGRWSDAAGRWHGDFLVGLEDLGDEEWRGWLEGTRTALRSKLAWVLSHLVEECEAAGKWGDCVAWSERWIQALPTDERAAIHLVKALRSDQREAEAAARHAALAMQLEDLTGEKPSGAFLQLTPEGRLVPGARPGVRGLLNPQLIGREKAMAVLTRAWAAARGGTGSAVIVEAGEGFGKTRLAEELIRYVRAGGGEPLVIEERAFAAESGRPMWVVRQLLARIANASGLAGASPDAVAALAAASPAIRERFPRAASTVALPLEEAVRLGLSAIADDTPVLLVLDDAPSADPASQEILGALLRRAPPGVLLVMTGDNSAWGTAQLGEDALELRHVTRVTLDPLTSDETRRLVESVMPMDAATSRALAELLHAHTSGRPALVLSQLRQLPDDDLLRLDESGRWVPVVPLDRIAGTMPAGIRELMTRRLQQLAPPSRRLLDAAAVLGPRIRPAVLELASQLPADEFREAMAQLISRRLLRQSAGLEPAFEFQGEAERLAVYDVMAPSARRRVHGAAARALDGIEGADAAEDARRHRRLAGRGAARRVVRAALLVLPLMGALGWWAWNSRGGAVTEGAQVLLATVLDLTGDSTLSAPLSEAARIGLQQSRHIHLYSRSQIRDALGRMRRVDSTGRIGEELAREIAQRDNLPAVIHLAVGRVDSTYILTGRLLDPATGQDLAVTKREVSRRAEILGAMDAVLARLRRALGESRADIYRTSQPLPLVTTISLPALEEYTSGRLAWTQRRYDEARDHWTRAVALDSAFALALASLGGYYFAIENNPSRGGVFFDQAMAHENHLTPREALAMRSNIAGFRGPPAEAIRLAEQAAERYPERDTWYSLGTLLMQQARYDQAQPAFLRAIELDSNFTNGWINLATVEQLRVQLPQAISAYERAGRLDTTVLYHPVLNLNQEYGATLLHAGKAGTAESVYRRMASYPDREHRARGLRSLTWLSIFRGRYREAADAIAEAVALYERDPGLTLFRNRAIGARVLASLGRTAEARTELRRAATTKGVEGFPVVYLYYTADVWLELGDLDEAWRILAAIERRANMNLREERSSVHLLRASRWLSRGNLDSAAAAVRGVDSDVLEGFRDALLTTIYEREGRPDSALAAAHRLDRKWQFGWEAEDRWVKAPLTVARLALSLGDTAAARAALDGMLTRWDKADPELAALREARRLHAQLSSGRATPP